MGLVDIVVVLIVLAFIVSRFFRFKLPSDPRNSSERRMDWDKLRATFRGEDPAVKDVTPVKDVSSRTRPARTKRPNIEGLTGIEQIRALDEGFDEQRFKDGTAAAYKYFCDCWSGQDEGALERLCSPELMQTLRGSLEDYAARGVKPWIADVSVSGVDIVNARVVGRSAVVEAEIAARQREGEGENGVRVGGEGSPAHMVRVRWVLARPLASDDPNWELQKIEHVGGRA